MPSDRSISVGIVGARGYVGAELIGLIAQHPRLRLAFAASRTQAGQPVPATGPDPMRFVEAEPDRVRALGADAVILAVPDGATAEYLDAAGDAVVIDLSSDHRFDDTWAYGLSEHFPTRIATSRRISNPGCYATAIQLAARPLLDLTDGPLHAFGVSGYSGAGTTPSPRNDAALLAEGITPYKLVDHTHEREVTHHLGRSVRFSPHVAPFFRGIVLTLHARLNPGVPESQITAAYANAFATTPLVRFKGSHTPRVQDIANRCDAEIGGLTIGGPDNRDLAVVCTVDNLLKGAASQAVQNLNLAFGLPSETGLLNRISP